MAHRLPRWPSVLAVVAHPDDESFGLGALLTAFTGAGATTSVLCFTHGEASTAPAATGPLYELRSRELQAAADALGVRTVTLLHYPDGQLAQICRTRLAGDIIDAARADHADGLLVFDPSGVTGHPDHAAATAAALTTAAAATDKPSRPACCGAGSICSATSSTCGCSNPNGMTGLATTLTHTPGGIEE